MPDDKPSLSIDTDWKKQAQEEKRKLVEEQQKKTAAVAIAGPENLARRFGMRI